MKYVIGVDDRLAENIIRCPTCGREYRSVASLNLHKRYYCQKQPSMACSLCRYKAYHRGNLKRHVVVHHGEQYVDAVLYKKK
ncbi:unnamed protein product [Acanthoscelides obtectus]|uniref:C2H2-type domain-containing protein n=1 Tax=Acanthoscelides obtectus TaxID=200917 RepID=A0A9P0K4J2_ACAOB|nr:unnamed protein product [Acanthoscelides obtectus]CAK1669660.1 Longitudinals lacking protein, isoforms A/B/D/L [Acanthoscelides obtectus]